MNDIERRALIGAAGIGAIAALSKAGPLNPPAGAVASTGRTLDEVYNKIPAPGTAPIGAFDGRIAIPGGTGPVTISQPGSYVLTGNITAASNTLTISSAGVTLDLNGFQVSTTSASVVSISVNGTSDQLVIRNGAVSGGLAGINVAAGALGVLIEDVTVSGAKFQGINFNGATSHGAVVRRCGVYNLGAATTASDSGFAVTGISTGSGLGCRVESCTVALLDHNGTPPVVVRGIQVAGAGGSIDGCVVANNVIIAGSLGTAMVVGGVYRNNKAHNFTTAYSGGTDGGGNF